jgi:hypothetical protein
MEVLSVRLGHTKRPDCGLLSADLAVGIVVLEG